MVQVYNQIQLLQPQNLNLFPQLIQPGYRKMIPDNMFLMVRQLLAKLAELIHRKTELILRSLELLFIQIPLLNLGHLQEVALPLKINLDEILLIKHTPLLKNTIHLLDFFNNAPLLLEHPDALYQLTEIYIHQMVLDEVIFH